MACETCSPSPAMQAPLLGCCPCRQTPLRKRAVDWSKQSNHAFIQPAHAFSRWRTTTGSDTTMKALGPNASLKTPPDSMNLQQKHCYPEHASKCSAFAVSQNAHAHAPLEQRLEQRLVAGQVRQLAGGHRDILAAHVRLEVPLADLPAATCAPSRNRLTLACLPVRPWQNSTVSSMYSVLRRWCQVITMVESAPTSHLC